MDKIPPSKWNKGDWVKYDDGHFSGIGWVYDWRVPCKKGTYRKATRKFALSTPYACVNLVVYSKVNQKPTFQLCDIEYCHRIPPPKWNGYEYVEQNEVG